jgi:hypothetical protein
MIRRRSLQVPPYLQFQQLWLASRFTVIQGRAFIFHLVYCFRRCTAGAASVLRSALPWGLSMLSAYCVAYAYAYPVYTTKMFRRDPNLDPNLC